MDESENALPVNADMQSDFLEIVADVRAHLEYQRALGLRAIEVVTQEQHASRRDAEDVSNPPVSPFSKGGPQTSPPLTKGGEGGFTVAHSEALAGVREELGDCTRCKLKGGRKSIVFGEGNPNSALVFVGEGPGYEEDQQGRPPDNRNPEPDEIEACEPFLIRQLQAIKPKVIVALGNVAAKTLLKTAEGITKLRGKWHMYQGIPLMPTFHPAYLLRTPGDKALVWKDIQQVMKEMEKIGKG